MRTTTSMTMRKVPSTTSRMKRSSWRHAVAGLDEAVLAFRLAAVRLALAAAALARHDLLAERRAVGGCAVERRPAGP
jgi:hypothetical protein